ncbi:MAG TPA: DinB family protein [Vicinamibacterales bacterium]|nr:DinB family protein [Vicinamibacterales bacterium]
MDADDLRTLLDYHYWARDRLLDAVTALTPEQLQRDLRSSFPSVRDTLVHLCLVEWIWHARWHGRSPTGPPRSPEEFTSLEQIRAYWHEQESNVRAFVAQLKEEDWSAEIDYRNTRGEAGRSSFAEMIRHLVNHGSYHRGQVTTMLRQLGASPARTMDLIAFYRERSRSAV